MKIALAKIEIAPNMIGVNALIPAWDSDYIKFKKIQNGEIIEIGIRRSRNIKHHRKYWGILNLCAAQKDNVTPDKLHAAVKIELGYIDIIQKFDGQITTVPQSIKFENMDQSEFERFYTAAVQLLSDYSGIPVSILENESVEYM